MSHHILTGMDLGAGRIIPSIVRAGLHHVEHRAGPLWFTEIQIGLQPWQDLRRIRIATCPWLGCKHYTSVFAVNVDGSIGEPIVGWVGASDDGPPSGDYWWDERPWCWFTTQFLTASPGGNQTYTSPANWNSSNNSIELLGAGASGARARWTSNAYCATGGAAGAYQKHTNLPFATPGTTTATYQIGAGGPGGVTASSGNSASNGNAGGDTWFDGATYGASTVGAKGGAAGTFGTAASSATSPAAAGGQASGGRGNSTAYNGGDAGDSGSFVSPTGGGGAAGPNGAGNSSSQVSVNGASGDAGSGGSGGAGSGTTASPGGNGTEWDASHGSGGGGGSAFGNAGNAVSGAGGLYGAGAGACLAANPSPSFTATTSGGSQGMIIVSYVPPFPGFAGGPVRMVYLRR